MLRIFLDASVLLAASGSSSGASRAIFAYATNHDWTLFSSRYAVSEVLKNLPKLGISATSDWKRLKPQITLAEDIITIDKPVVFEASKDRPILFTALAWTDILLTLDKIDFKSFLGKSFYGMDVLLPYDFLKRERDAGRL